MASPGEDPTLDVQINVNANVAGADQAQKAIRGVKQEVEDSGVAAAAASGRYGSAFGRIVTGSRNLSASMRGVTAVMRGGIFTLGGFAQGLNALMNVVRAAVVASGPWALLALAIGAVIGVLRGLMTMANKAARELRTTGDSTKEMTDRARELGEALAKVEGEKFADELKHVASEADKAMRQFKMLADIQKEIRGERMKQEELRIKAGPGTDEQKAVALLRLRQKMTETEQAESLKALDFENQFQAQRVAGFKAQENFQSKTLAEREREQQQLQLQLAARKEQEAIIAKAQKEIEGISEAAATSGVPISEEGVTAMMTAKQQIAAARAKLGEMPSESALVQSIVELEKPISELTAALNELRKTIAAETTKLGGMREDAEIARRGARDITTARRATTEAGVSAEAAKSTLYYKALIENQQRDVDEARATVNRLAQGGAAMAEMFNAAQVTANSMVDSLAATTRLFRESQRQMRNTQTTNGP